MARLDGQISAVLNFRIAMIWRIGVRKFAKKGKIISRNLRLTRECSQSKKGINHFIEPRIPWKWIRKGPFNQQKNIIF